MKGEIVGVIVMTAAVGFGGTMCDSSDERHAWALEDGYCPVPDLVTTDFGGRPSDAVSFDSAATVKAELASDCQLHFAAKEPAKLKIFGVDPLAGVAAKPGEDGWIVYDVVFHRPAEGHAGHSMAFVNGLLAKEAVVEVAKEKTPLVLTAKGLCACWIRRAPAPWSIKTHGRYADAKVVAETREKTAAAMFADYRTREWPAKLSEVERCARKTEFAVQIYSYCTKEPYATAFNEACAEFQKLVDGGKVSNPLMTSVSRALLPLRNHGVVKDDHPLVKALAAHGIKGW